MRWLILQIGLWVVGYFVINLSPWTMGVFTAGAAGYWLASLYGTLFNLFIFYLHSDYLLPKLLKHKRWPEYLFLTLGLLLISSVAESGLDHIFLRYYPLQYPIGFSELLENNLAIHGLFFLFFSFLFRFSQDWFIHERQQQILKAEKLSAELSYLKAQINPHFLFNTLNNLFASAHQSQDDKTANGIAKLAHMMRYMLEESEEERVPLANEIQHLKHYMDLQNLRFSAEDSVVIDFTHSGNLTDLQIPPLLLIPFVENAYKHGVRLEKDSFIQIYLEAKKDQLLFSVKNSWHDQKVQVINAEGGIGLQNVRKRLELLYPDRHQLKISQINHCFEVELNLELDS
ncbi:MAG: sensor histidine kinase [Saprospiraceae bacterium]